MSNTQALLTQTVRRLLSELQGTPQLVFVTAWERIVDLGLPALMICEEAGGFGGGWGDLFAVQWEVGHAAAAVPLGEAILANRVCTSAGREPLEGFGSVALDIHGTLDAGSFTGVCRNVPWGRHARWVIGRGAEGVWMRLDTRNNKVSQAVNLAGEPRDTLSLENAACDVWEPSTLPLEMMEIGALLRLGQIAGALSATLAMTTEHVRTRVQFGKPLGAFQAVQQQLAVFVGEVAAAHCAARAACLCVDAALTQGTAGCADRNPSYAIAAAKLRANLAIGTATATAHQLHGALGFTQECALHRFTRRLWAWRTEAGNDRFWSASLGAHVAKRGAEVLWDDLIRV